MNILNGWYYVFVVCFVIGFKIAIKFKILTIEEAILITCIMILGDIVFYFLYLRKKDKGGRK